MQQPLVHHFVQPPVQPPVQLEVQAFVQPPVQPPVQLEVQYFVQPPVQPLVQLVQERHGSGVTTVLLVQLRTHAVVQPASHMPAWASDFPPSTEMTM